MKRKDGFSGERSIVLPPMIIEMEKADPLVSSLYITDIGYYPHAENHYRERSEPINQHVLIYCMEGSGWYRVGNEQPNALSHETNLQSVHANQFFILPAGKPHAYGTNEKEPWTIYWVHFTGNHASIYAEGAQQPQDVRPNVKSRISDRNHIFEEIFNTLYQGYSRENLRFVSSLLHYYLASMRYIQQFRNADNNLVYDETESNQLVMAVTHYMEENMEKKITLQDLANYTGYSTSHFSMLFRKGTGMSPLSYFNKVKIQKACEMLDSTDIKINQLCFKVGIEDCYYFSRLFNKMMGMSPREYRSRRGVRF